MRMLFGLGAVALGAILAVIPAPASAQTDEQRAGARAAGLAGLDAYQAGKYDQAVDFFTRAESLMHAPTHLLYLARGNVKLGHWVSAREYYLKLTQDHLAATASKPFRDAQAAGEKELNELEPRIPYVSVVVQGAGSAKNVQVTRDDERIPEALLGVPHPEDPGSHTFKAVAENMESAASTITLKEGSHETVLLTLNVTSAPAAAAHPSTTTGTASLESGPEVADRPRSGSALKPVGFVLGGVGLVGIGVGVGFLVKGKSSRKKADDLNAACLASNSCRQDDTEQQLNKYDDDANSQRTVGGVSLAFGGAALGTGIILLIVDASSSSSATAARRVEPVFGLNYAGLAGTF